MNNNNNNNISSEQRMVVAGSRWELSEWCWAASRDCCCAQMCLTAIADIVAVWILRRWRGAALLLSKCIIIIRGRLTWICVAGGDSHDGARCQGGSKAPGAGKQGPSPSPAIPSASSNGPDTPPLVFHDINGKGHYRVATSSKAQEEATEEEVWDARGRMCV